LSFCLTTGTFFATFRHWIEAHVPGLSYLNAFLPFVLLSLAFGLFYQLMPHAKVDWRAALVGGAVGGCLWQMNNIFNVIYVSKVVTNSKIYGGLSIVPVFLIGLYFSWTILLFGAQVAYAFQNRRAYVQARLTESVNQRGREFIAFRVMTAAGLRFHRGAPPPTVAEMADRLGVPSRLAGQVVQVLVNAKLLSEIVGLEMGYAPARPLEQITGADILQALRAGQGQELTTLEDPTRALVREEFERIQRVEQDTAARTTLQSLVNGALAAEARVGSS